MRLYCFPYAGGGPGVFHPWRKVAPAGIEIFPLCLPGRSTRLLEKPLASMPEVVAAMAAEIAPEPPFAFFGHSLGALVAFEMARHLRRLGRSGPTHLIVASRGGPRLPRHDPETRQLTDEAFLQVIGQRYRPIPPAILAEKEMLELLLPGLRADFALFETYRYTRDEPLACSITVFGGAQDERVPPENLDSWKEETVAECHVHVLPGGHFFFENDPAQLLRMVYAAMV